MVAPILFAAALASTIAPSLANLLDPLPPKEGAATDLSLKFQPALDFDMDGCYHVTALDLKSNFNEGMEPFNPAGNMWCRTPEHLMHSNAYVRRRCNHGWCAYMYGYYFEKDEGIGDQHRHDWEHVIIWTLHDEIFYVSWSAHADYTTKHKDDRALRFHDGTHLKVVYHLGGVRTHSFRLATPDDETPENHWGQWFMAWLVEITWMEPWSSMLVQHDWGSAHPDFGDWKTRPGERDRFGDNLAKFAPWDAIHNEGFDPYGDDDTFNTRSMPLGSVLRSNSTLVKQDL